uniref:Uncharacterized protein n=1 Tax=Oryza rufipogon TaxID=4529 RepID=A0A0E0N8V0_ORYRU
MFNDAAISDMNTGFILMMTGSALPPPTARCALIISLVDHPGNVFKKLIFSLKLDKNDEIKH